MNRKEFIEYCWSFYGPGGIYGEQFFGNTMDRGELEAACDERMKDPAYEGDSIDREAVRDALMAARKAFVAKRRAQKELA